MVSKAATLDSINITAITIVVVQSVLQDNNTLCWVELLFSFGQFAEELLAD